MALVSVDQKVTLTCFYQRMILFFSDWKVKLDQNVALVQFDWRVVLVQLDWNMVLI